MPFPFMAAAVLGSGILGYAGARAANRANRRAAEEQMRFQERMSATSYQRAMQDMRKAGLNPMLAYSQGGASTPGGAMSTAQNEAEGSIANALQAARSYAEIKNLREMNKQIQTQADLNRALADETRVRSQVKEGDVPLAQLKKDATSAVANAARSARSVLQSPDSSPVEYASASMASSRAKKGRAYLENRLKNLPTELKLRELKKRREGK